MSDAVFEFMGRAVTLPQPHERMLELDAFDISDVITPARAFVESVRHFGVITPVVVCNDGTKLRVVDGRRRIAAARIVGLRGVPATVYEAASFISDLVAMVLNEQRHDNPVADFNAIQRLQQRGASECEISQITGMPLGRIRRRMKLGALHPDLFEGLGRGALSVAVAESCAALSLSHQASLRDRLREKGRLTMPDVQEVRKARKAQAVETLALEGLGGLISAAATPASLTEMAAALSTRTLQCICDELPAEPRFDIARQIIMRELAEGWRAPLAADTFIHASAKAPTR